jgi:hypothetical protein
MINSEGPVFSAPDQIEIASKAKLWFWFSGVDTKEARSSERASLASSFQPDVGSALQFRTVGWFSA